ncbi:hypothetical protein ACLOJK_003998 [Asimina triloba]
MLQVQGWIKSGLRDFSISRASVEWGIPVPSDTKQTIYVWFDALLGKHAEFLYVSALLEEKEEPTLKNAVCSGWPASLHLIGKPATTSEIFFLNSDNLTIVKDLIIQRRELKGVLKEFNSAEMRKFEWTWDLTLFNGIDKSFDLGKTSEEMILLGIVESKVGKLWRVHKSFSMGQTCIGSCFIAYVPDILRFHAVYWPAMLMSAGFSSPKMVFGHGFLTKKYIAVKETKIKPLDGMKMGKSLGNTLEPRDLLQRFGTDAVRYFFLREVEFGNDGDFSEERFINIVNAHLANTIGNLLNRTLGLLKKNCQSTLAVDSTIAAEGNSLKGTVENLVEKAKFHYNNLSLSSACECVLEIGNAGNLYIDEHAPWLLFKKGGASAATAAKDLVILLETMRIIGIALSPIAPSLCLRIYSQLGYSKEQFEDVTWKWMGRIRRKILSKGGEYEDLWEEEEKNVRLRRKAKEN